MRRCQKLFHAPQGQSRAHSTISRRQFNAGVTLIYKNVLDHVMIIENINLEDTD